MWTAYLESELSRQLMQLGIALFLATVYPLAWWVVIRMVLRTTIASKAPAERNRP